MIDSNRDFSNNWYEHELEREEKLSEKKIYPLVKVFRRVMSVALCVIALFILLVHPINRFKFCYFLTQNCRITVAVDPGLSESVVKIHNGYIHVVTTIENYDFSAGGIYMSEDEEYYKIDGDQTYVYSDLWRKWMPQNMVGEDDGGEFTAIKKILDRRNYEFKEFKWRIKEDVDTGEYKDVNIEFGLNLKISCTYKGMKLTFIFDKIGFTRVDPPIK